MTKPEQVRKPRARLRVLKPRIAQAELSTLRPTLSTAMTRLTGRRLQERNARILTAHPLCAECERHNLITAASEVDHIRPLADGGVDDESNLQPLCTECHKAKSAREAWARSGCLEGVRTDAGWEVS